MKIINKATKKIVLGSFVGVLSMVNIASADVVFKGDAKITGYSVEQASGDNASGFDQLFGISADFTGSNGMKFKSRILLSDTKWEGDSHTNSSVGNGTAGNVSGPSSNASADTGVLDYAYVQFPMYGWTVRAGRQQANSSLCLFTCDDRRDRILAMKTINGYTVIGLYDKRVEGALNDSSDDLDGWAMVVVGKLGRFMSDLTIGGWISDTHGLDEALIISPHVKGKVAGVDLDLMYAYLGGGEGAFTDHHHSIAIRGSKQFGDIKLEGQYVASIDGGLFAGGFDTYSSVLSNSPDHNQSATLIKKFGGVAVGQKGKDETLLATRVSGKVGNISLAGAVGYWDYEGASGDGSDAFYDVKVGVEVLKDTTLSLTYGALVGDTDRAAAGITLKTSF